MHALAHPLAGDRQRPPAGRAGLAVGRDRELEHDLRAAFAHAPDVAGMGAPRLGGADADVDRDAGGAQPRMARAGDLRVGVFERGDHARDAGGDDRVGAGRRLAVMRAGLERHVERGAARCLAGAAAAPRSRHAAGRRLASSRARRSTPLATTTAPDGRIGPGAPEPAPAERERQRHEAESCAAAALKAHGRVTLTVGSPVSRTSLICATAPAVSQSSSPTIPRAPPRNPWLRGNCDRPRRSAHRRHRRGRADAPSPSRRWSRR